MKIQIRQNCFETNSSTMHTLTICNKNTDMYVKDYIGKIISIPSKEYVKDETRWKMKRNNMIYKLNALWNSSIGYNCNIGDFIHRMDFLKSTLNKIGITLDISMDENLYRHCEYEGEGLFILDQVFGEKDKKENEDRLINFLFNPDSWWDCYEDSYGGCPYENDIPADNETFWERDG